MAFFTRGQNPRPQKETEPLISPEADKTLWKIVIAYGGSFVTLFLLAPLLVSYANLTKSPLFPIHRFIDTLSTMLIMLPFFFGINAMNKARMKFARQYAAEENWKAVYGSTETFSQFGQKWMDSSGEAHYLLAIALERLGHRPEATKARLFVTKYRPNGEWAAKLREVEAGRAPRKISEIKAAAKGDSVRKLAKAKRRF
jgi:hypothetical protein